MEKIMAKSRSKAAVARRRAANKAKRERIAQYRPKTPPFPVRITGMDPGTDNFGWSVMEFKTRTQIRLIRCGMLQNRVKELIGDLPKEMALPFRKEIQRVVRKSRPDVIGIERYVPRRQGLSNESVNYMIGHILCYHAHTSISISLMLAATWKNSFNRLMNIEGFYEQCKPVPDHVVDSVLIGIYAAGLRQVFNTDKLKTKTFLKQLAKQIKTTYVI